MCVLSVVEKGGTCKYWVGRTYGDPREDRCRSPGNGLDCVTGEIIVVPARRNYGGQFCRYKERGLGYQDLIVNGVSYRIGVDMSYYSDSDVSPTSNPTEAAEDRKHIVIALDSLRVEVSHLEKHAEELRKVLDPVLHPAPEGELRDCNAKDGGAPLGYDIAALRDRVKNVNVGLRDIFDRLEV